MACRKLQMLIDGSEGGRYVLTEHDTSQSHTVCGLGQGPRASHGR